MELSALSLLAVVIAIVYGVLYITYGYIRVLYLRRRMPPRPFPFPVSGNIFQVVAIRHWMQFEKAIPELMYLPSWLNPLPSIVRGLAVTSNKYFYALCVEAQESTQDNFAKWLLHEKQEQGLTRIEIANLTGNFIGGGVDTTTSTILSFILAMVLHPDIQKRAQEKIDAVVSRDQSPTWAHQSQETRSDSEAYGVSQVSSPLPFRVRLEPRSEAIRDMLGETAVAGASGLQAYDGETHVTFESAQSVSFDMPVAPAEA
ncbi:cytochrome P450 [Ilyonectria robusta]